MKLIFIAGLILFIGSLILICKNYEKLKVDRSGIIVKMRIERLPASCIGAKVRYFVSLSYKGKLYDKATRGDFCERHHQGELVDIKWLNGSKYILWPNESGLANLLAFVVLGLFGLGVSVFQWKKMNTAN